jgi:hypothetical protein
MSLYQREKSWYYDFMYRGHRYRGCIGPVSKAIAKEIMAKKKAEAVEGRYELPSKKPSPRLEEFSKEYFAITKPTGSPALYSGIKRHTVPYNPRLDISA